MRLRRLAAAVATAVLVVATAGAVQSFAHRTRVTSGARVVDAKVSTHAGTIAYEAYLPKGYATSGKRYPVVYFLHGLPAGSTAYQANGWVQSALDRTGRSAILILPQGARDDDTDPEYLGAWEQAIADDLPRQIDARYRTIPTRAGRAIIGVSAGGYGAMHIALAHLGTFSAVESWSGYFHPTDPTGNYTRDLGSASKNAAANVHKQFVALEQRTDKLPLYIAFYIGRSDPTGNFVAENEQLNQELSAAGVAHVFRLYPGTHSTTLWQPEATAWLTLALNHLAAAK
jgi:S-formylglutathione hydrolase FrmB